VGVAVGRGAQAGPSGWPQNASSEASPRQSDGGPASATADPHAPGEGPGFPAFIAPLAATLALAAIGCGILAFAAARQADDGQAAARRAFLIGAIAEFRTRFAASTLGWATDVANRWSAAALPGGGIVPPDRDRHRHERAYLINADGRLVASYPASEDEIPPALRRFAAELGAEGDVRHLAAGGTTSTAVFVDFILADETPALAAVAMMRGPFRAGAADTAGPMLVSLTRLDSGLLETLRGSSGFADVDIAANPADREDHDHALLDRHGRIIGWVSWTDERPMTRAVIPVVLLLGGVVICLLGLLALSRGLLRRSAQGFAASAERARAMAYQDAITGLPNRRRMLAFLDHALADRRADAVVAFAFIDPNGFTEINDALGHHGGDQLLAAIGERLQGVIPPSGLVGRFGGDEFALVVVCDDPDAGLRAAKTVSDAVARPFWMNGQVIQVAASIGVVQAPRDGSSRNDLTRRADLALRAAKKLGRGRTLEFEPTMEAEFEDRRFLKQELRRALGDGALELHYQPIVVADRARICGVEALARWDHPTRGRIPPNVFVPVAEQTGLMEALGEFVLRKALADAMRWPNLYMSLNISPVQIRNRGFVDLVAGVMKETGIAPSRVVLEVTEGVLIDDPDEGQKQLERLRALGLRIALDDFGVGYSSLSYLQRFAFDKLKIDKEFVAPLGRSGNGAVMIQSIVALGRALGLSVLAEGVETEEQRVLLRLAGCDEMQGYLFAKPAPRETVDELVANAETRGIVGRAAPRALEASFG
jgi:diguanylate cyclase (GGDEF)-like protein